MDDDTKNLEQFDVEETLDNELDSYISEEEEETDTEDTIEDDDDEPFEDEQEDIESIKAELAKERESRLKAEEAIKKSKFLEKTKKQTITHPTTPSDEDDVRKDLEYLKNIEKKRQFQYENNLSPKVVDYLFKIKDNPTKEDLADPFIKGGIKEITRREKVAQATPSSSASTRTIIRSNKNWNDMTSEERKAAYENRK